MNLEQYEGQLSDVFPGDVKPVRDGVYLRNYIGLWVWCRFEAGSWYLFGNKYAHAEAETKVSAAQNLPWQGFKENPEC